MRRLHLPIVLACVLVAGCGGVRARRDHHPHHARSAAHPALTGSTADGGGRCAACGDDLFFGLAEAERALARGARAEGHDWGRAVVAHRDAAALAATALDDPAAADPGRAIAVHNAAVERLLRLTWGRGNGRDARRALALLGIAVVGANPTLDPDRAERLDFAADYRIAGLSHRFANPGLGVPVVVSRRNPREARQTVEDRYLPERVVAAATAVLRPTGGGRATLTLHDPFEEAQVAASAGRTCPLAADRTAALALQVERDRSLRGAAFGGALTADLRRFDERLALLRPHRPGKIPVVLVHGLASSPLIWAETVNELGNDAALNERFEFWFFLYASGEPIPLSAARLREALAAARVDFDPAGADPSLRRMVVVGHSQGGLLTKTLVQDSGLTLWDEVLNIPHPAALLPAEAQARLGRGLIYGRDPGVRRLVFVGTPHRGSPVADQPLVRGLSGIARPESGVADDARAIRAAYGRDAIEGGLRGDILGLGNLRTDSPVLLGLNKIPADPSVPRHTIALHLDRFNPHDGDGLVPYASAHLDDAASELVVPGFHLDINRPGVTEELRRILNLHLKEGRPSVSDGDAHSGRGDVDRA